MVSPPSAGSQRVMTTFLPLCSGPMSERKKLAVELGGGGTDREVLVGVDLRAGRVGAGVAEALRRRRRGRDAEVVRAPRQVERAAQVLVLHLEDVPASWRGVRDAAELPPAPAREVRRVGVERVPRIRGARAGTSSCPRDPYRWSVQAFRDSIVGLSVSSSGVGSTWWRVNVVFMDGWFCEPLVARVAVGREAAPSRGSSRRR